MSTRTAPATTFFVCDPRFCGFDIMAEMIYNMPVIHPRLHYRRNTDAPSHTRVHVTVISGLLIIIVIGSA